jgi:hypothetical protein
MVHRGYDAHLRCLNGQVLLLAYAKNGKIIAVNIVKIYKLINNQMIIDF